MKRNISRPIPMLATTVALAAVACGGDGGSSAEEASPLFRPAALAETAPESFRVRFETSKGDFVVEVERSLAPNGADRLYTLAKNGYYEGVRFYRVIPGFMAQFGMHADPRINAVWANAPIEDDPVVGSNTRGTVTFAMRGTPNSRTTQLFVNFGDNSNLDEMGFAPVGSVVEGMDVVDELYGGYGESAARGGNGPLQQNIAARGNEYLDEGFPEMDYVVSATIEGGGGA